MIYPLADMDGLWRAQTLYSLVRRALDERRSNIISSHRNATGIIAYARIFQAKLARVRYKNNSDGEIVSNELFYNDYDFESLEKSVNARSGLSEWHSARRLQLLIFLVTTIFTLSTLTLAHIRLRYSISDITGESYQLPDMASSINFIVSDEPILFALIIPIFMTIVVAVLFDVFFSKRRISNIVTNNWRKIRAWLAGRVGFRLAHFIMVGLMIFGFLVFVSVVFAPLLIFMRVAL